MTTAISPHIAIQLAYTTPNHQHVIPIKVPTGATIESAILASGICQICPEIDLAKNKVGIFGCVLPLSHGLLEGDRVEIYRPLLIDPKTARRLRHSRNPN
ncbi:MAG: RnfH family protein [Gammaproteobacteria bacterium]|jgi:putative ubiquitin-RnfH superfamily antitoxin RatB of RatAB toxin-antitoxin module|nr:RnfH family protein [Gammaproteobacteria bacterium]